MNFVKVVKMALVAGFVVATLMGQPLATQAADIVPEEEVQPAAAGIPKVWRATDVTLKRG